MDHNSQWISDFVWINQREFSKLVGFSGPKMNDGKTVKKIELFFGTNMANMKCEKHDL